MNTSNGQFNIYTDTSIQGKIHKSKWIMEMNLAKQLLARKYKETQNTGFE
jgi:hypothetical protein